MVTDKVEKIFEVSISGVGFDPVNLLLKCGPDSDCDTASLGGLTG